MIFKKLLLLILYTLINIIGLSAQKLPSKKIVLKTLTLINHYFMNKWPDPGIPIITNRERPSNIWTRAVYYEGLMALYNIDPQKQYYLYTVDWAEKHKWGLRTGTFTRNADDQACGQTYIDLYLMDKKPERINEIKSAIDSMVHSEKNDDWNWIDALQMAMPVFTKLGLLYKDTNYYRKMNVMYNFTRNNYGIHGLYNQDDHLWWRDKDFVSPYKEPNGKNCYWSRGNGWVIAALVRTLAQLPLTDPHYNEYLQDYKDMCRALISIQRDDGFWNVSLLDSTHFGGKETSGTALFIYGFAWGVNNKILDKNQFRPIIIKAWNAIVRNAVHPDGAIGYMQGTGKEPKDGQPLGYNKIPDFEDYGLGCLLLAGSEVYKMK